MQRRKAVILCDENHVVKNQPHLRSIDFVTPIQRLLEAEGFDVTLLKRGAEVLQALEDAPIDLVLAEMGVPDLEDFHRRLDQKYARHSAPGKRPAIIHLYPPGDWSHSPSPEVRADASLMRLIQPSDHRMFRAYIRRAFEHRDATAGAEP